MANHLHHSVILMGAGPHTFSSQLKWTGFWRPNLQPPGARESLGEAPSAWRFWGFTTKI